MKKHAGSLSSTRRVFLSSSAALAAGGLLHNIGVANALPPHEAGLAADPLRPQFHLLPASNWMNDPNGPIFFNGKYHMFFQYNPKAAVWGNVSWYHSVSVDMIHWTHLPVAMTPTLGGPDAYGCFSGSAIQVGKRVYAVYTGTVESTPDEATIRDGSSKIKESQCLAWSDDPDLIHWKKDPQSIVPSPPSELKTTGFRDPSAWKQGDWYYMTVGSGVAKVGGCVLLYRSRDMKDWEYTHQLTTGIWTGSPTSNPCDDGEMWECPEFFALDGGHVLIYSTEGKVFWQSGRLDVDSMRFYPAKTGVLDLDAFYAPKTQLDATGKRILWGWIPERRPAEQYSASGWAGVMSLPRELRLDAGGVLRMRFLPCLATLRSAPLPLVDSANEIKIILKKACAEVICEAPKSVGSWDFVMKEFNSDTELVRISYSAEKHAFITGSKEVMLESADTPQIHAYVDGSVIEILLSERAGDTKRFYYPQAKSTALSVHLLQDKRAPITISAWEIKPISDNRLTT